MWTHRAVRARENRNSAACPDSNVRYGVAVEIVHTGKRIAERRQALLERIVQYAQQRASGTGKQRDLTLRFATVDLRVRSGNREIGNSIAIQVSDPRNGPAKLIEISGCRIVQRTDRSETEAESRIDHNQQRDRGHGARPLSRCGE